MSFLKTFARKIGEFFRDLRDDFRDLRALHPKHWLSALSRNLRSWRESAAGWRPERRTRRTEDRSESPARRSAIALLWSDYVSLVAKVLNWMGSRWRFFLENPLWLRALIAFGLLVGLLAGAASPWIFKEARQRQARNMLAEARAVQKTDSLAAFAKGRAAALMQLDDSDALELALELADQAGTPEAVWWSERLALQRGFDEASMKRVVETALRHGQTAKAAQSLAALKTRHSGDKTLAETEVQVLLAQDKASEAWSLSMAALQSGDDNPLFHSITVDLGLKSSSTDRQGFALAHLREHVFRGDEVGLALARVVLQAETSTLERLEERLDLARLLRFVRSHEDAERFDRTAAVGFALRTGMMDRSTAFEEVTKEFDLAERDELLLLLETLGRFGLYDFYPQVITEEHLGTEREFVLAKVAGLVLQDDPDPGEAGMLLEAGGGPGVAAVPASLKNLWKGVLAGLEGDPEAMRTGIVGAVDHSRPGDWGYMVKVIEQVGLPGPMLLFYRELYEHSGKHPVIASRYLRLAYLHAEEEELARVVQQLSPENLRQNRESMALLLYLKTVFEESMDESRPYAEDLVAEHPTDLGYLLVLAYMYARSGAQDYARQMLASPDAEQVFASRSGNLEPYLRLCYAAVTGNGAGTLDPETLPTQRERGILERLLDGRLTNRRAVTVRGG